MSLKNSNKKKVRGTKRKCKSMIRSINDMTTDFPAIDMSRGYWHIHLPVSQEFIDSSKTPSKTRKACIQTLINRVCYLIDIKPNIDINVRVIACITLPKLRNSQIVVFFSENYYKNFFNRDSEEQKWKPLPSQRSISKEYNLDLPIGLSEKGYQEETVDENRKSKSELWFIGELS